MNAAMKVALVTGVSSGIGRATAILLSDNGFQVFGTKRNPRGTDEELNGVTILPLDVRDGASVDVCVQTVLDSAGRVDALVNNAGSTLVGSLEETSIDEAQNLFDTNFFGVMRMAQAVLPAMRKQGSGRIVNIGSVAGFVPMPFQGVYSATKHAIEGFSESLDHEVRQFGVRVSVVEPGFVRTDIDRNRQIANHLVSDYDRPRETVLSINPRNVARGEEPIQVAEIVLKAVQSRNPQLRYLAGRQARLTSLLIKFMPTAVFDSGLRKQAGLASV